MKFTIKNKQKGSLARTGILETPHGTIQTPVFMPVGTAGIVKTLAPWEVEELGAEIILGNTYHLHLRPGADNVASWGGLHHWSKWPKPILTDSGGYQAYSLGTTRAKTAAPATPSNLALHGGRAKTTNDGVRFYSHLDGSKHYFTPESVLDIQQKLGSDIVMPLDDCPPIEASEKRIYSAVLRTTSWAERSIAHWQKQGMGSSIILEVDESGNYPSGYESSRPATAQLSRSSSLVHQGMDTMPARSPRRPGENNPPTQTKGIFGIIQGGIHQKLREQSAKEIQALPFDGIAIGGVAIASEGKEKINRAVEYVAPLLDPTRPHYLMGVGYPEDIIRMVHQGMDMFDCVLPTRLARHGVFWTSALTQHNLRRAEFKADQQPLDPECQCRICQSFSRSYLRHLYTGNETFALRALSYHNLFVILRLLEEIRRTISDGTFTKRYQKYLG